MGKRDIHFTENLTYAEYNPLPSVEKRFSETTDNIMRDRMLRNIRLTMEREFTDRQKQCFMMSHFDDMKAEEIASALNIGVHSVYKHIRMAKGKLKHYSVYL